MIQKKGKKQAVNKGQKGGAAANSVANLKASSQKKIQVENSKAPAKKPQQDSNAAVKAKKVPNKPIKQKDAEATENNNTKNAVKPAAKQEKSENSSPSENQKAKVKLRQRTRKNRKVNRLQPGEVKIPVKELSIEALKERIEILSQRQSKTAKRKLRLLRKQLLLKEEGPKSGENQKAEKKNEDTVETGKRKQVQKEDQQNKKLKSDKQNETAQKKGSKANQKIKVEDEKDEDEDEDEEMEEEEEIEEEEEDESDEDDEDTDDEEMEKKQEKVEPQQTANKKTPEKQDGKKKRFVLFVGGLPKDITAETIKAHFLTKVSSVVSVRVPPSKGIAFVEFSNQEDYEKGLSMHNSFINGRRINVQYSSPNINDPNQRKNVIAKTKKLNAMRNKGKFTGNQQKNKRFGGKKGQKA